MLDVAAFAKYILNNTGSFGATYLDAIGDVFMLLTAYSFWFSASVC